MEMKEILDFMINNGVGVVCIAYFMFRDYHFMQKLSDTLSTLQTTLNLLNEEIHTKE